MLCQRMSGSTHVQRMCRGAERPWNDIHTLDRKMAGRVDGHTMPHVQKISKNDERKEWELPRWVCNNTQERETRRGNPPGFFFLSSFPHGHRTEERRRRVQCLDSPYYIEAGGIIKKSINSRALLQYSVGWMATNTTSHTPFFLFCIPRRNYRNPAASRQLALKRERSGGVIFEERERATHFIYLFILLLLFIWNK